MAVRYQDLAEASGAEGGERHPFVPDPWAAADVEYEHHDGWLLSYIDILTLFLTLFVILLVLQPKADGPLQQERAPYPESVVEAVEQPIDLEPEPLPSSVPEIIAQTTEEILPAISVEAAAEPLPQEPFVDAPRPAPPLEPLEQKREEPAVVVEAAPQQVQPEAPPAQVETPVVEESPSPAPTAVEEMLDRLNSEGLSERLRATQVAEGVRLEVRDNILFAPASADLTDEGREVLGELARVFKGHQGIISVEGHTDNVPISSPRYPSNWELSSSRATRVARYLIEKGMLPSQLRAVGYADTRPLASNDTPAGRAKNRRVSLIVQFEPHASAEETQAPQTNTVPSESPAKMRQT